METTKSKMGRRPLPPDQKKQLFRFYVSPSVVSMVGGKEKLTEYLNQALLKKAIELSDKELKEMEQKSKPVASYLGNWRK